MNTNISGPLISLIVPVYNVKDYLKTCLQSILEQTYKNLVDDGSDDGSSGICDEYARMDQRIKTIHLPHSGVSAARNAGLAAATGELLGFVDSDDWIDHDMYQYLYTLMQEHDVQVLPIFDLIAKVGNIPEHDMFNTFNMGVGMTVVVDKADADKAIAAIKAAGEEAYVLGELVESDEGVIIC